MATESRHLLSPDIPAPITDKAAYSRAIETPEHVQARLETDHALGHQAVLKPASGIPIPAANTASESALLKAENKILRQQLKALAEHIQQLAKETAPLLTDPEQAAAEARAHAERMRHFT